MSDYTLLRVALSLGGILSAVVPDPDKMAFQEHAEAGGSVGSLAFTPGETDSARGAPLSKAHIRPHIEYRSGAGLLKSHKGGEKQDQVGGGKRGGIEGFSDDARRRLMYTVASVRNDAPLPLFITLTYPEKFPDPKASKRHLKMFLQRLNRWIPKHGTIWKLEPQQRGAPHYHLLTWGCDLHWMREIVPAFWSDIASGGDPLHLAWHQGELGNGNVHCVQQVRSRRGVLAYASKYLGKTFNVAGWDEKWTGRFWGVANRDAVPFGELVQQEVTSKKAVEVMRYQKRFSGLKRNNNSLTIFCDADQWVTKLGIGGDQSF